MSRFRSFQRTVASLAMVAAFAFMAPSAFAGGNGAFTQTQNLHKVPLTFPVGTQCGAPAGVVSGTFNEVMHVTINKAGDVWVTVTQEGWFTFVAEDPTMPTFAGHFAVWFGLSDNNRNSVMHDTFNIRAIATDGSGAILDMHAVDHVSVSANGQVNLFMDCH
jgi:hypothetical protein